MVKQADSSLILNLSRVLNASRERVWYAWTDPLRLKEWFAPSAGMGTCLAEVDFRAGGAWRIGMGAARNPILISGRYLEIVPPEKLVFTWNWQPGMFDTMRETQVTILLRDLGGSKTELTLLHEGFKTAQERDDHEWGWSGCLQQLAKRLAR